MPAKTQVVIDRIKYQLNDAGAKRFTLADISRALNEAGLILSESPMATMTELVLTLGAGFRQDLRVIDTTRSYVALDSMLCNVAPDGTDSKSVRTVDKATLDTVWREWRMMPKGNEVEEYFLDPKYPQVFDVFPPVNAGVKARVRARLRPAACCVLNAGGTALANADELVPVNEGFEVAMGDYALFRLFGKDAGDQTYAARAQTHLQLAQLAAGMAARSGA
jgi:hypothetical protein